MTNIEKLEINEKQEVINRENLENTNIEINTLNKENNENIIPGTSEIRKPTYYYKNKLKTIT